MPPPAVPAAPAQAEPLPAAEAPPTASSPPSTETVPPTPPPPPQSLERAPTFGQLWGGWAKEEPGDGDAGGGGEGGEDGARDPTVLRQPLQPQQPDSVAERDELSDDGSFEEDPDGHTHELNDD